MRLFWFPVSIALSLLVSIGPGCGPAPTSVSQELMRFQSGLFANDVTRITAANLDQVLRENREFPTNTLKIQSEALAAPVWRIFQILTDESRFQAATGAPATSISRPGSVFLKDDALFGGAIRALTFRIVAGSEGVDVYQLWHGASPLPADHPTHAGQMSMPGDYYTLVHFEIRPIDAKTSRLSIHQHGVPAYSEDHFAFGWKNFYIVSVQKALAAP